MNLDMKWVLVIAAITLVLAAMFMDRIIAWVKAQWKAWEDKRAATVLARTTDVVDEEEVPENAADQAAWKITELEAQFVSMMDKFGTDALPHIDQLRKLIFGQPLLDPTLSMALQMAIVAKDKDATESIHAVQMWVQTHTLLTPPVTEAPKA
jgi:hypothetical protein